MHSLVGLVDSSSEENDDSEEEGVPSNSRLGEILCGITVCSVPGLFLGGGAVLLSLLFHGSIAGISFPIHELLYVVLAAGGIGASTSSVAGVWYYYHRRKKRRHVLLSQPLLDDEERGDGKREKTQRKSESFMLLLRISKPDSGRIFIAVLFLLLAAVATGFIPRLVGQIVDEVSMGNRKKFEEKLGFLIMWGALAGIGAGGRGGIFTLCMGSLNVRLRDLLFRKLIRQEMGFFDTSKAGELTSRLTTDTEKVSDAIALNINVMLRSIVQAIVVIVFMLHTSPNLTLVTCASIPVFTIIAKVYGKFVKKLVKETQAEVAAGNVIAEESLSAMKTIKSYAAEEQAIKEFNEKLESFIKLNRKYSIAYSLMALLYNFLPQVVSALVLLTGGREVLRGEITSGQLYSFMLYQISLTSSFNVMADVFTSFAGALGAADKVNEYINRKPKLEATGSFIPEKLDGDIVLKNVYLRYPARPEMLSLRGLSLHASPGQTLALVGPSGGGKSSCLALLKNFYETETGSVMIDGRDIHDYNSDWIQKKMALVAQEPVLFCRSIYENIIYGEGVDEKTKPSLEDVKSAAKLANAHEFILSLPEGYDTVCGERGVALSGGQKQRIAIARALIRKPAVLLLDEATSALDSESEYMVQSAIDNLMKGNTTVIIIAHRLSTIQNADNICYIENGQCTESGKHAELIQLDSGYASLVQRQMSPASSE